MVGHGTMMLWWECPYPSKVTIVYVGYIIFMLLLFLNFYLFKHFFGKKKKLQVKRQ
jgi:hypothetical protein